jgi:hypothetical protein
MKAKNMKNFLQKLSLSLGLLCVTPNLMAMQSVTVDTWSEYSNGAEFDVYMQGLIMELEFTKKIALVTASAAGMEIDQHSGEKRSTAKDWALYPKYNFLHPKKDGTPGFSLMAGGVLPTGHNFLSSPNRAYMALAIFPMKLFDERLNLETHLGHRYIDVEGDEDVNRFHWGVFLEAKMHEEYNFFTNIYTGTQYDIDVPSLSQEYGFSYDYNKNLKYKILFGIQPELEGVHDAETTEYWGELGFEIRFSEFD